MASHGLRTLGQRSGLLRPAAETATRAFSAAAAAKPIQFEIDMPFTTHNIDGPDLKVTTSKSELWKMFSDMYTMRRMEIAADVLYKGKFIKGFCHLYDGQEAVGMGIEAAASYKDSIVTSYRDHTYQYTRGDSIKNVLGELMGKYTRG